MLNRMQVESLSRRLVAGEDVSEHEGLPVCSVLDWEVDQGEILEQEQSGGVALRMPAVIMGSPEIPTCLDGIRDTLLHVPSKRLRRFASAKVVGWRSILTPIGFHSSAQVFLSGDQSRFFGTHHEGFLCSDGNLHFVGPSGDPIRLPGRTLFLGGLEAGNYGSFLFRLLPKLLYFRDLSIAVDHIVVPERSGFLMAAIELAGLEHVNVIAAREAVNIVFDELYSLDDIDAEGAVCGLTRERIVRLVGRRGAPSRRLYVSRYLSTGYRPRYRPLVNELDVQKEMASRGFEVIYPEIMTMRDQMSCFAAAEAIVGPSGSGMLNALFAPSGVKVLDLESYTTTVRQHAKIYSSVGAAYGFVFGRFMAQNEVPPHLRKWEIDVQLVRDGLDKLESGAGDLS